MPRRERARILGDVLDNLDHLADGQAARTSLAGLSARANLPHDRLQLYLAELRRHGLVNEKRLPELTGKGQQFLECYRAWIRIQAMYGIQDGEPDVPLATLIGLKAV